MKAREIMMMCVKTRIVSWLTTSAQPVVVHTIDGGHGVVAVYANGKYVPPSEVVQIPDSPRDLWGPDGPIPQPPEDESGTEQGESDGN